MSEKLQKSGKILVSSRKDVYIPTESMGIFGLKLLKRGGNNTAVIDAHTGKTLTYEELLNFSITTALSLKKSGVKKNDVVAIMSANSIHSPIPLFATLYLGAIAHVTNANHTFYELTTIFNTTRPKCIFCSVKNLETLLQLKGQMSFIKLLITFENTTNQATTLEEILQSKVDIYNFTPEDVDSEDVAYIFNSSGTTGMPKCVMLTHQNTVSSTVLNGLEVTAAIKKEDSLLLPIPFFHIYGFCYLITTLAASAKCVIMEKFVPDLYLQTIEKYKINKLTCPPPLMKFLAQTSLVDNYNLSSVIDITTGSSALQDDTFKMVEKRLNAEIRQGYGITEMTGACAFTPPGVNKPGSCGIILPTLTAKICNPETSEILGPNETGELHFKGCVTMKGYLGNPEATKQCFDEDGFYRTGDLGYYDDDGYIYLIDRLKEIIKCKGFQVSPVELENIILLHPAVLDVGVVGVPNERAGEVAMALVILKEGFNDVLEDTIVDFVSEHVNSEKWLYGGVKFVKELPKTAIGKLSRKSLKEMVNSPMQLTH